jgi:pantothenate kinase
MLDGQIPIDQMNMGINAMGQQFTPQQVQMLQAIKQQRGINHSNSVAGINQVNLQLLQQLQAQQVQQQRQLLYMQNMNNNMSNNPKQSPLMSGGNMLDPQRLRTASTGQRFMVFYW